MIRVKDEPAGQKPPDVPGHVWKDEENPNAGSCEASWHWVLYKLDDKEESR